MEYLENRILEEGDIVNVDVTAIVDGYYGDTSRMYSIGKISVKAQNLIDATYESLMRSIKILKPGVKLGDIGNEIQNMLKLKVFLSSEISVVMVLVINFMSHLIFFIMEKKIRVRN